MLFRRHIHLNQLLLIDGNSESAEPVYLNNSGTYLIHCYDIQPQSLPAIRPGERHENNLTWKEVQLKTFWQWSLLHERLTVSNKYHAVQSTLLPDSSYIFFSPYNIEQCCLGPHLRFSIFFLLLYHSQAWSWAIHNSTSLKYEPASEPQNIPMKQFLLDQLLLHENTTRLQRKQPSFNALVCTFGKLLACDVMRLWRACRAKLSTPEIF